MAIHVKCDRETVEKILLRAEAFLDGKAELSGYAAEDPEDVRVQISAVYSACEDLCDDIMTLGNSQEEIFPGNWCTNAPVILELMGKLPQNLKAAAAYCLAAINQLKLHPLLICLNDDIFVGTWLYKDYNAGEDVIRSEEFTETAYNRDGLMLPFSCAALLAGKSFSESVKYSCGKLSDYIFAVDLERENRKLHGSLIKSIPRYHLTDDAENDAEENAEEKFNANFGEYGRNDGGNNNPERINILKLCRALEEQGITGWGLQDGMEEQGITRAFFEKSDEAGKEISSAVLMETPGSEKDALIREQMISALTGNKKLLVLANPETKARITEKLDRDNLSVFLGRSMSSGPVGRTFHPYINAAQLKPYVSAPGAVFMAGRLSQIKEKIAAYEAIRSEETVKGISFEKLEEMAMDAADDYAHSCQFLKDSAVLTKPAEQESADDQILFSQDSCGIFREYVDVWKQSICKTEDGIECFDLNSMQEDDVKLFSEMLGKSETVISRFFSELSAYGSRIGKDAKEKIDTGFLLQLCELALSCKDILDVEQQDNLPEEEEDEAAAVEEYRNLRNAEEILKEIRTPVNRNAVCSLDDERMALLGESAGHLNDQNLDVVSIPIPRQLTKDAETLEHELKSAGICHKDVSLRPVAGKNRNRNLKNISRLFAHPQLIRALKNAADYENVESVFGWATSKNGYIFSLQREAADSIIRLKNHPANTEKTLELIDETIACLTEEEYGFTDRMSEFLEQSDRFYSEFYTPFHQMEKEIFGFLNLSYAAFDDRYPDRMLHEFIEEWRGYFAEGGAWEQLSHMNAVIDRSGMRQITDAIKAHFKDPDEGYCCFEAYWLTGAYQYWKKAKKFDKDDYEMTRESFRNLEKRVEKEENGKCFNAILEARKGDIRDGKLPVNVCLMTPEESVDLLNHEISFERLLVADGEMIPFYQVLAGASLSLAVTVVAAQTPEMAGKEPEEHEAESATESAFSRAIRMNFCKVPADESV